MSQTDSHPCKNDLSEFICVAITMFTSDPLIDAKLRFVYGGVVLENTAEVLDVLRNVERGIHLGPLHRCIRSAVCTIRDTDHVVGSELCCVQRVVVHELPIGFCVCGGERNIEGNVHRLDETTESKEGLLILHHSAHG